MNITTGSSNIDIGNSGFSTDNSIIRIGSTQSDAFLAGSLHLSANLTVSGIISGNGAGVTNLNFTRPMLFAVLTNNLTISNNVEQRIWFNNIISSNNINYSTNSGFTIGATGIYEISATIAWQGVTGSSSGILYLVKNGGDYLSAQSNPTQNGSLNLSAAIPLFSGDIVDFRAWQNHGSPVTIAGNATPACQTYLTFRKVQ